MSTEHSADEPIAVYDIVELGAPKQWRLALYPDWFRLEPAECEPHEIARDELPELVQVFNRGLFLRQVLAVTLGKKKVLFKLTPEAFAEVSAWIGPPTAEDLKFTLKRRFGWVLPIGFLFVVLALPIGDMPLDPVSLGLGLMLILTGTLAKLSPHRIYFALDSLWFSFLAANSIWLLTQEWGWLQLMLLLLQLGLVRSGWQEFSRFAPQRMAGDPETESDQHGEQYPS